MILPAISRDGNRDESWNEKDGQVFEKIGKEHTSRQPNHSHTIHDPTVRFLRLIVLIERAEDTMKYFSYELTPIPTSLFNGNFMWHVKKSQLADVLIHYWQNKVHKERGKAEERKCLEWCSSKKKEKKKWWCSKKRWAERMWRRRICIQ